jgi:hypothetical protein
MEERQKYEGRRKNEGRSMKEALRKKACTRLPATAILAERVGNAFFHFFSLRFWP